MKRILVVLAGIVFTVGVGFYVNHGQDWSAGAGDTPRTMLTEYYSLAYDQGKGADAAREYFAPDAVDLAADAPDRQNGPPIGHKIHEIVVDGRNVAVHHSIDATASTPAIEAVDIYTIMRGKFVRRVRIAQPAG